MTLREQLAEAGKKFDGRVTNGSLNAQMDVVNSALSAPDPMRYQICADESGHTYFIPVDEVRAFERWVANDGMPTTDMDRTFDCNRIDGRFTFTDPRCE